MFAMYDKRLIMIINIVIRELSIKRVILPEGLTLQKQDTDHVFRSVKCTYYLLTTLVINKRLTFAEDDGTALGT